MSASWLGAIAGLAIGLMGWYALRRIANRVEQINPEGTGPESARVLRIAALADLVLMPVVGYLVGLTLAG